MPDSSHLSFRRRNRALLKVVNRYFSVLSLPAFRVCPFVLTRPLSSVKPSNEEGLPALMLYPARLFQRNPESNCDPKLPGICHGLSTKIRLFNEWAKS